MSIDLDMHTIGNIMISENDKLRSLLTQLIELHTFICQTFSRCKFILGYIEDQHIFSFILDIACVLKDLHQQKLIFSLIQEFINIGNSFPSYHSDFSNSFIQMIENDEVLNEKLLNYCDDPQNIRSKKFSNDIRIYFENYFDFVNEE